MNSFYNWLKANAALSDGQFDYDDGQIIDVSRLQANAVRAFQAMAAADARRASKCDFDLEDFKQLF
jgi:hypothetical protein